MAEENKSNIESATVSGLSVGMAIFLAFLFFGMASWFSTMKYEPLKENALVTVTGKLTNVPVIYSDQKHRKSITIFLDSYPGTSFLLSDNTYKASDPGKITTALKKGDSLFIGVKRNDLADLKKAGSSIKDRDNYLLVYTLKDKNNTYQELAKYNAVAKEDYSFTPDTAPWILVLIGSYFAYESWRIRRRKSLVKEAKVR